MMLGSRSLTERLKLTLMISALATWSTIGFVFVSATYADFVTNHDAFWQVAGIVGFILGIFLAVYFRNSPKCYFASCVLLALLIEAFLYAAFLLAFAGTELGLNYLFLGILLPTVGSVAAAAVISGLFVAFLFPVANSQQQ